MGCPLSAARSALVAWAPAVAWAGLLFLASSIPGDEVPQPSFVLADKLVHGAVYAVLGFLCARGIRLSVVRANTDAFVCVLGVGLATLYGVLDEVHQMFVPSRSPEFLDLVADLVGASLGAAIFAVHRRRRLRRSPAEAAARGK